jgi:hypothetical protein
MRFAFPAGLFFLLATSAVAHTAPLLSRHANHTVDLNSTSVAAVNGSHTAANSTTYGQDDGDCDDDDSDGTPPANSTIVANSTMVANTSSLSNSSSESTDFECETVMARTARPLCRGRAPPCLPLRRRCHLRHPLQRHLLRWPRPQGSGLLFLLSKPHPPARPRRRIPLLQTQMDVEG